MRLFGRIFRVTGSRVEAGVEACAAQAAGASDDYGSDTVDVSS
jgi:hypothetical protein